MFIEHARHMRRYHYASCAVVKQRPSWLTLCIDQLPDGDML